ncbi:MAG: 2'-deoxycytidine 5'-triphosphate deaminase [Candidatus Peribacteria bacterium]|nr:MAG: 2'-deoxycytidine 5'-triphosphate deaminase [Candidatus Peribacteria bacterium]
MKSLVDKELKRLLADGVISHISDSVDLSEYVQPASIDLPVGDVIYHVKKKYLPFDALLREVLDDVLIEEYDASESMTLYKNQTYLIPCLRIQ